MRNTAPRRPIVRSNLSDFLASILPTICSILCRGLLCAHRHSQILQPLPQPLGDSAANHHQGSPHVHFRNWCPLYRLGFTLLLPTMATPPRPSNPACLPRRFLRWSLGLYRAKERSRNVPVQRSHQRRQPLEGWCQATLVEEHEGW